MSKLSRFWQTDKKLHFSYSFGIFCTAALFVPLQVAIIVALAAGILKEVYDYRSYGEFSWEDVVANCVGILCAVLIHVIALVVN